MICGNSERQNLVSYTIYIECKPKAQSPSSSISNPHPHPILVLMKLTVRRDGRGVGVGGNEMNSRIVFLLMCCVDFELVLTNTVSRVGLLFATSD